MWRGLRSSHLLLSGHRRSRAFNRAGRGDLNRPLLLYVYVVCLPPMRRLTSLKWSFCRKELELRSEYAEHFPDIFYGLSHSVPVKVASRLTPGSEMQDSYNLNACRYGTILHQKNDGQGRTQLHCFAECISCQRSRFWRNPPTFLTLFHHPDHDFQNCAFCSVAYNAEMQAQLNLSTAN